MKKLCLLKKRIKKNEGFSKSVYLDKLGNPTIGYGHLIKYNEKFLLNKKYCKLADYPRLKGLNKKYSKTSLETLFEKDFTKAICDFKNHYSLKKMDHRIQEVLIEMIFQLGIKNTLKFKKFNFFLKKNFFYLAALEMLDSKWHLQTPKRVERHIKILLKY